MTKAVKIRNKVKSPRNKTNSHINVKPRRGGNELKVTEKQNQ